MESARQAVTHIGDSSVIPWQTLKEELIEAGAMGFPSTRWSPQHVLLNMFDNIFERKIQYDTVCIITYNHKV